MSEPKKTMLQLETLIKKEAAKSIAVSMWPDTDGWKVACRSPHPLQDKECCEQVRTEADRLRLKFDLNP
jgi:hypothetical protein